MKSFLFMGAICAVVLFGCSNDGSKFVGKWQSTDDRVFPTNEFLLIDKKDDQYILRKSKDLTDTVKLIYNKEGKYLSGSVNGADIDIKYLKETDHITLGALGDTRFVEFKKED
ncbi:hypothetical protein ACFQ3S_14960 [Mucilaginibacter terrae]|uniref:hypothetical protein n=1 Tax=Mucilaginibacter terrae TaxID=1955052 RepID=UPI00363AA495